MRPQNKHQRYVFDLSQELHELHKYQKQWAFDTIAKHKGFRLKSGITSCLSCGHKYQGSATAKRELCPSCGRKLHVETTTKKKDSQRLFWVVIDVVNEFQVHRFFEMWCHARSGEVPLVYTQEVCQQWLQEDNKLDVLIARNRGGQSCFQDNFHGELTIKDSLYGRYGVNKYDIYPDKVYPKFKCLPEFKRNGFKGNLGGCTPYQLFKAVLRDSMAETLLKAKFYGFLEARVYDQKSDIEKYWQSIKIAIRKGYKLNYAQTKDWLDYLKLLQYFGRDLKSPKYLFPKSLHKEHNRYVRKKSMADNKAKIDGAEPAYKIAKAPYFGLVFKEGNITISVLQSVREFYEEWQKHKHCVFTNAYYEKANSLVLAAFINGVSVETIEVNLKDLKVVQSRGFGNKPTEHHQKIIALVTKNMGRIAEAKNFSKPKKSKVKQSIAA